MDPTPGKLTAYLVALNEDGHVLVQGSTSAPALPQIELDYDSSAFFITPVFDRGREAFTALCTAKEDRIGFTFHLGGSRPVHVYVGHLAPSAGREWRRVDTLPPYEVLLTTLVKEHLVVLQARAQIEILDRLAVDRQTDAILLRKERDYAEAQLNSLRQRS